MQDYSISPPPSPPIHVGVRCGGFVFLLLKGNHVRYSLLQFPGHPFGGEEDGVPWFCYVTAESHVAYAPAGPG